MANFEASEQSEPQLQTDPDTGHVYTQEDNRHRQLMQICVNCRSPRLIPDPDTIRGYRQNPWPCHRAPEQPTVAEPGVPWCNECSGPYPDEWLQQYGGHWDTCPNRHEHARSTTDAERISAQAEENSMEPTDESTPPTDEEQIAADASKVAGLDGLALDDLAALVRTSSVGWLTELIRITQYVEREHSLRASGAARLRANLREILTNEAQAYPETPQPPVPSAGPILSPVEHGRIHGAGVARGV